MVIQRKTRGREEGKGCLFPKSPALGWFLVGLIPPSGWPRETFYCVPSEAVGGGRVEIYSTAGVHSSPSSLAAAGAVFLSTAFHTPAWAEAHDNFQFGNTQMSGKKYTAQRSWEDKPQGWGDSATESSHLTAPTNLSPPLACLSGSQTLFNFFSFPRIPPLLWRG